jgi:alkylation response protein AidB-like acyl-CoA dehydrogenase
MSEYRSERQRAGDPGEQRAIHVEDLEAFRASVRSWLAAHAPRKRPVTDFTELDRDEEADAVAEARRFQAALFDAGLAGLTWPKEYGGQGLGPEYQRVYVEEAAPYELRERYFRISIGAVGPTLLELGTESQKRTLLPAILRGEHTWCQLFSEPGAGSDLASLQTRAARDGDEWAVNGQKVWTSGAHRADRGVLIARTDPDVPKHDGLTMFLLDMKTPGVIVRPLRQITGETHFNEVFLDDVRIPVDDVLGEVGGGWKCSTALLTNERVAVGTGVGGGPSGEVENFPRLLELARERGVASDPLIRQELAAVYIRQRSLGLLRQRTRAVTRTGRPAGPPGSLAKLATAVTSQHSANLALRLAGAGGQAWLPDHGEEGRWCHLALTTRSRSIGGGTSEIQRNIIGERVLGLPREPDPSRSVPYRDLLVNPQGDRARSITTT